MACESLSQQPVRMNVSLGSLPEGFCPASMQEFGDALAARLVVTPNQAFTSFAAGSIPPTSNVGPWFKDCEIFFVWSDIFGMYIPMEKGGFDNEQYITTTGNFVVPEFIYQVRATAWGGGGGGYNVSGPTSGGAGGGGGFGRTIFAVTPGQVIPVTVGTGGSNGAPGTAGGSTTFLTLVSNGGATGTPAAVGSLGGTSNGAFNIRGGAGGEASSFSGGASPQGGSGGIVDSASTILLLNGVVPGGGGAGGFASKNVNGGSGANGAILVEW